MRPNFSILPIPTDLLHQNATVKMQFGPRKPGKNLSQAVKVQGIRTAFSLTKTFTLNCRYQGWVKPFYCALKTEKKLPLKFSPMQIK